ncbi:MAG: lytic transglycosylase domain-containing protein, partial [Deltaproteobacteria bacterium]|nr:lytic transglycosylase domain-containing protein [Deltaproteobacteria bacterium]
YPLSYYALISSARILKISKKWKTETLYTTLEKKKPFERKFIRLADPGTMKNRRLALLTELFRLGLTGRALAELKAFHNDTSVNADDREWIAADIYNGMGYYSLSHSAVKQSNGYERFYPGEGDGALFFKLLYPAPFREIVEKQAKKHKVDPALVYGIMREESGFNSQISSWAGAIGLLQLMPATANRMAKGIYKNSVSDKLTDPDVNIALGVKYLGFLSRLLKHPAKVIAAYNAGEGSVISWEKKNKNIEIDEFVEEISARETRYYVKRVLQSYYRYKYLYGKGKEKFLKL